MGKCHLNYIIENIFISFKLNNSSDIKLDFYTAEESVFIEDIIQVDQNSKIII